MAETAERSIRGAMPDDADHPVGTLVEGTDHNAAASLLFRWLAIWDAPDAFEVGPLWRDLLEIAACCDTLDASGEGSDAIAAAVVAARAWARYAHEVGHDSPRLLWQGGNVFGLTAEVDQRRAGKGKDSGGEVESRFRLDATLRRRSDGRMVFRSIGMEAVGPAVDSPPIDSFDVNRAKATMIQFQTNADLLSGNAVPMAELLMPRLELNGLVNSKADESDAATAFTDVRDLRESISSEQRKHDNVIRTFDEFSDWFANCAGLFRPGGFHKLERFEVTPLGGERFQVTAQFHWTAETINGAPISLHVPLTWILAETGDTFMRIEKLLPFG